MKTYRLDKDHKIEVEARDDGGFFVTFFEHWREVGWVSLTHPEIYADMETVAFDFGLETI